MLNDLELAIAAVALQTHPVLADSILRRQAQGVDKVL